MPLVSSDVRFIRGAQFHLKCLGFVFLYIAHAHAELNMQCFENCRGYGTLPWVCQQRCSEMEIRMGQSSVEIQNGSGPTGALGGLYDGIRRAEESSLRQQKIRQLELQNKILEQQIESRRQRPEQGSINSRISNNEGANESNKSEFREPRGDYEKGLALLNGGATEEGKIAGFKFIASAADNGYLPAIEAMVKASWDGYVLTEDKERAIQYARMGAPKGSSICQLVLALAYAKGLGGNNKDVHQEFYWMNKAAHGGNARAKFFLGVMYLNGDGVPKNLDEAIRWLSIGEYPVRAESEFILGRAYIESGVISKSLDSVNQGLVRIRNAQKLGNKNAARVLASEDEIRRLAVRN